MQKSDSKDTTQEQRGVDWEHYKLSEQEKKLLKFAKEYVKKSVMKDGLEELRVSYFGVPFDANVLQENESVKRIMQDPNYVFTLWYNMLITQDDLNLKTFIMARPFLAAAIVRGIDPNIVSDQLEKKVHKNRTLLHEISKYGDVSFAELILKNGADPEVIDADGKMPRDYAKSVQMQQLLDVYAKNFVRLVQKK